MFTTGMGTVATAAFTLATMAIAVPTGVKIFNWIGTLWQGHLMMRTPMMFALGFVWLIIHIAILYAGVRLFKAPIFLGATSPMANIGGSASAPVVAAAYNQSMAPVGLLMAIVGGTLGTPVALIIIGGACKVISGE